MDKLVFRNQIFLDRETGELHRVLWISPDMQYVYWINMTSQSAMPTRVEIRTIQEMMESETLEESDEISKFRTALTSMERKRRDRLWGLLKDALLDEPQIYDRHKRAEHLKRIAMESGLQMTNLYPYLA